MAVVYDAAKDEIRRDAEELKCEICGNTNHCFYNEIIIEGEKKTVCFMCEAQI